MPLYTPSGYLPAETQPEISRELRYLKAVTPYEYEYLKHKVYLLIAWGQYPGFLSINDKRRVLLVHRHPNALDGTCC